MSVAAVAERVGDAAENVPNERLWKDEAFLLVPLVQLCEIRILCKLICNAVFWFILEFVNICWKKRPAQDLHHILAAS